MLTIDLGTMEFYNGETNQFVYKDFGTVRFEYSLKMVYEWEAKWKKSFLSGERTDAELIDLYMMMALDPIEEDALTEEVMEQLSAYIADPSTATRFTEVNNGQNGNKMLRNKEYTAEEIYALMIMNNVPLEFENRNLNRLMAVLRIISAYNSPPKKMTQEEIMQQNRELNRKRREEMKTKG